MGGIDIALRGADVVIALSNSGETGEILTIVPIIKRLGVPLLSMTGKPDSTLAREADINLDVGVEKEACPLGLAPTASRARIRDPYANEDCS